MSKKRFTVEKDTYVETTAPWQKTRYLVVDREGFESPVYFTKKAEAEDYAYEANEANEA